MGKIDTPLVSVIINTRNRAKLLARSINSVLLQTYKNFELIIIDGASTDNTEQVILGFDDKRIRYIKQIENISATDSKIKALRLCKGDYVTFNDDDDEWFPSKLEKQLLILNSLPEDYGCVYCWEEFWDDKDNKFMYANKPDLWGDVYLNILKEPGGVGGGGLLLFRKSAIDYFLDNDFNMQLGSDYQMNLVIAKEYKYFFFPEILCRTHVNHIYERMSDKTSSIFNSARRAQFYEKILQQHKSTFQEYPKLKLYHCRQITYFYALDKNIKYLKFAMNLMLLDFFSLKNHKTIAKSFLAFIGLVK